MCLVVPPVLLGGTKGHLVIFAVVMKIVGKKSMAREMKELGTGWSLVLDSLTLWHHQQVQLLAQGKYQFL